MKTVQNTNSGEKKSGSKQKESDAPVEPVSEKDEVKEAEERTQQAQKDAGLKKTQQDTGKD